MLVNNIIAKSLLILSLTAAVTGCKVAVIAPSGGDVTALDATRRCQGGNICEFNIEDKTFNESFTAVARPGYVFSKWAAGPGFLCPDSVNPTCVVNNTVLPTGYPAFDAVIAGDMFFYAMPLFDFVGIDTDEDGILNHLDDDDDNDGIPDVDDPCPLEPNPDCGINEVSGIFYEDLYWRKEDGPYVIVGNVTIPEFFNLNIEAGAEVSTQAGNIIVNGNIYVTGTQEEPANLNNTTIYLDPNTSSIIDIDFAEFDCGSVGNYAIRTSPGAFRVQTPTTISNSRFVDCYNYIYLTNVSGDPTVVIEKNVFDGSRSVFHGEKLNIQNNLFMREISEAEVSLRSGPLFNHNTILFHPSTGGISSIITTIGTGVDIDGTNNYWGTDDFRVIDLIIYDANDVGGSYPALNYIPFLNAPHPDTPTL